MYIVKPLFKILKMNDIYLLTMNINREQNYNFIFKKGKKKSFIIKDQYLNLLNFQG